MPSPAHGLIVLILVSSAGFGVVLTSSDAPSNRATFGGRVVRVDWNPHFEVAVSFAVENASANATYSVELGPPWWWAEVGLPEIRVNDTLRVEGVLEEDGVLQVYTIWINGGGAVVLREDGKPAWAEVASGRPGGGS